MEPKMIKGPDIFLKTIASLKSSIPELFILLTGPARGYVRNGLEKMGVPYVHHFLNDYTDIGRYFNALDAISSVKMKAVQKPCSKPWPAEHRS